MTNARTSLSHPLQIAAVQAGAGLGSVGVTFCPGKVQPHAATGAWARDLATDMAAIADWGAVCIVTLVEQHELEALQVEALGQVAADHSIEWLHLPIVDVSVPDTAFEAAWRSVGGGLRSRLRSGFDILAHCKGGLGRAGMIAARLLIDCGMAPEAALAKVRAVRPGAVETAAQAQYVLSLEPLDEPTPATDDAAIEDRALGALLGLAVGDAVGTTLEFSRRDSKPQLTDMVGGGPFGLKPGEWTDDTAMALALADSLAERPSFDAGDLMARFVDWHRRGTYSCTGRCFDIGVTTRAALSHFERTGDPCSGSTDPQSAGNGSLMRLAPVALKHWRDRERLAEVAALQSRTTHAAREAIDACVVFADMLADAIAGLTLDDVLVSPRSSASRTISTVASGGWRGKRRDEIRSSGYVVLSLEAALWCIARTSDFRSAVLVAANLGDDADTVAAITGQLAGALYGKSGIPAEWLAKLAWGARIETAARNLLA